MSNTPPFIQSIRIHKVRHLQDVDILLDESRPRHLILTGPNGSGKTSLLRFLKEYLEGIPGQRLLHVDDWKRDIVNREKSINDANISLSKAATDEDKVCYHQVIYNNTQVIDQLKSRITSFCTLTLALSDLLKLMESYNKGEFIISFFEAKRNSQIQAVSGAQKLDLPKLHSVTVNPQSIGTRFLQFLVNQENRGALLNRKGDQIGVREIDAWMNNITAKFREIFQNKGLTLDYDIDNFDFTIKIPGREPFRLVDNQLSDGFSSILHVVSELLMRMEAVTAGSYNIPGIVLIDEIETHLHIRLQKTILPFLTTFFPKIQFIVTTHSPFVLTSLRDAVIFDLETHARWENIAPLSASTVVENYFDLDLYSDEIKHMISRYEDLSGLASRTPEQQDEIDRLHQDLDVVDYENAPELVAHYRSLRAKESVK